MASYIQTFRADSSLEFDAWVMPDQAVSRTLLADDLDIGKYVLVECLKDNSGCLIMEGILPVEFIKSDEFEDTDTCVSAMKGRGVIGMRIGHMGVYSAALESKAEGTFGLLISHNILIHPN